MFAWLQLYVDLIRYRALKINEAAVKVVEECCNEIKVLAPLETIAFKKSNERAFREGHESTSACWAPSPDSRHAAVLTEVRSKLLSRAEVEARFLEELADMSTFNGDVDRWMQSCFLRIRDALTIDIVIPEAVYESAAKIISKRLLAQPDALSVEAAEIQLEFPAEDDDVAWAQDIAYPFVVKLQTPATLTSSETIQSTCLDLDSPMAFTSSDVACNLCCLC